MNKPLDALIEALKQALAGPGPLPLFRSPKQPGLFTSRTGLAGDAARQALRDGLLEVVHREVKGKTETEMVRVTPLGVQFLAQHESPKAVLEELVRLLQMNRDGLPRWVEEMRSQLHALTNRFSELFDRQGRHLEHLARRAEAALERLGGLHQPLDAWQLAALEYLAQRRHAGAAACPLAELFKALHDRHAELTLGVFHEGLAELRDRGAAELMPYAGHLSDLPEPEFALLEGSAVYSAVKALG